MWPEHLAQICGCRKFVTKNRRRGDFCALSLLQFNSGRILYKKGLHGVKDDRHNQALKDAGNRLLLDCARAALGGVPSRVVLPSEVDWVRLVEQAERQRLLPVLHAVLPAEAPDACRADLAARRRAQTARNLALLEAARRVAAAFAAAGIETALCKGPLLAELAWGGIDRRPFCDLDFLVRQEAAASALGELRKLGFVPRDNFTPVQERVFMRLRGARHCEDANGLCVELHVTVAPRYFAPAVAEEGWLGRRRQYRIGADEFPGLSPEDQLITGCVHGARHLWSCLSHVVDIAGLLRAFPSLDFSLVRERGRRLGAHRRLCLGLALAAKHLGGALPPAVAAEMAAEAWLGPLLARAEAFLFDPLAEYPGRLAIARFQLACLDSFGARFGYCRRLLGTTAPGDWQAFPLPAPLFFLYAVLRPLRLLASCRNGRRA